MAAAITILAFDDDDEDGNPAGLDAIDRARRDAAGTLYVVRHLIRSAIHKLDMIANTRGQARPGRYGGAWVGAVGRG